MKQIEFLRTIIYQLIGENQFLLNAIDCVKQRDDTVPFVDLSNCGGSSYWPPRRIIIGVPDIIGCNNLLQSIDILQDEDLIFQIIKNYWDLKDRFKRCSGVIVNMPMTQFECDEIENLLKKSCFLKDEKCLSIYDAATIYSLAYSLYHEFGHVIHNEYIPDSAPFKRENVADTFAFEAVKSMMNDKNEIILIVGVFISIIYVLKKRTPKEETDDKDHPHSIERLYSFLLFWGIPDDSDYWKLAYEVISKWCNKNRLPITWERATSESPKDKFTDAYMYFRKTSQNSYYATSTT